VVKILSAIPARKRWKGRLSVLAASMRKPNTLL
jgi:hypothetical protein